MSVRGLMNPYIDVGELGIQLTKDDYVMLSYENSMLAEKLPRNMSQVFYRYKNDKNYVNIVKFPSVRLITFRSNNVFTPY